MRRSIPAVLCVLCLAAGLTAGWYLGYTRPVAENQRRILTEYEHVRGAFHATDEEMADFGTRLPEMWEAIHRQDEMAAAMAWHAHRLVHQGDTNRAMELLAKTVRMYWIDHHDNGNSNLIANIERYASNNAAFSNVVYGVTK